MFDISFAELLVISVVALIVIGPERLPRVARTFGFLVGRARRYVEAVKSEIRNEIELDELRRIKDTVHEAAQSIEQSVKKEIQQIHTAVHPSSSDSQDKISKVTTPDSSSHSRIEASSIESQSVSSPKITESTNK